MSRSLGPILFNGPIKIDRLLADSATTQLLLLYLNRKALCRRIGCTNSVPIVKKQSKDSQNSKNDHWCTNRHILTKTVPTMYQQCTNRQKQSKKSKDSRNSKMTIGVPIVTMVTCLPRLYQQCTNSVPIVKNSENSQKTLKTAKK